MIIGYIRDDGGRAAAGFKGNAGDCVVRAIAILTRVPYRDVDRRMAAAMKQPGYAASCGGYRQKARPGLRPRMPVRQVHNLVKASCGLRRGRVGRAPRGRPRRTGVPRRAAGSSLSSRHPIHDPGAGNGADRRAVPAKSRPRTATTGHSQRRRLAPRRAADGPAEAIPIHSGAPSGSSATSRPTTRNASARPSPTSTGASAKRSTASPSGSARTTRASRSSSATR